MTKKAITITVAAVGAAGTVIAAIITGCFGLMKPAQASAQTTIQSNSVNASSVLTGNTASNITIQAASNMNVGSFVNINSLTSTTARIDIGGKTDVSIDYSSNVNVTTVRDITVGSGGVGVNQGTVNQGSSPK